MITENEAKPSTEARGPKRQFSGILPSPSIQLKYAIYNSAFVSFFVSTFHLIIVNRIRALIEEGPGISADGSYLPLLIDFVGTASLMVGFVAFTFTFFSTLLITHRFVGPTIAISNFVDELLRGDFRRTLKFRKSDEMIDLAEKLNELRNQLAKYESSSSHLK